jgi:hypothetical protein
MLLNSRAQTCSTTDFLLGRQSGLTHTYFVFTIPAGKSYNHGKFRSTP